MSRRGARAVFAGLALAFAAAVLAAPTGSADPDQPGPTAPGGPSATSSTDELTDMVLDAIQNGIENGTVAPPAPHGARPGQ